MSSAQLSARDSKGQVQTRVKWQIVAEKWRTASSQILLNKLLEQIGHFCENVCLVWECPSAAPPAACGITCGYNEQMRIRFLCPWTQVTQLSLEYQRGFHTRCQKQKLQLPSELAHWWTVCCWRYKIFGDTASIIC